ncbi:MAG TPA: hypothetical protein VHD56_01090 [Tepidisphaeraceae bacterium]|nr:hypothetical protein [Tepidisphaeraceae bacterium]
MGDLRIEFDSDVDGDATTNFTDVDAVRLSGAGIKLSVDSNNDGVLDAKDEPGKGGGASQILHVNDDDTDADGVPDYADGFDRFADDSRDNTDADFFKGAGLSIPDWVDLSKAKVKFVYNESSPLDVGRSGDWALGQPRKYTLPATGALRLWKYYAPGTSRNKNSVQNDGTFIKSGEVVDAAKIFGNTKSTLVFMEAVKPTADGAISIAVYLDPLGDGNFVSSDKVVVTARER